MLLWEELHPYIAAHAVRLRGRADVASLSAAAHRAALETGIGELALHGDKRAYQYLPLHTIPVRELPEAIDADKTLCTVITEELKTPFPAGPHHPIRWIVFNDMTRNTHFVVLVYHHVASDGLGVQAFLGLVLAYYLCSLDDFEKPPLVTFPNHREQTPGRRKRQPQYLRPLVRTAREYFRLRLAHRMHERKGGGEEATFLVRGAGDGLVDRLGRVCRDRKVGLNDLVLAATGSALADLTPLRRGHRKRRKLALSTVVSLRMKVNSERENGFGVFLRDCMILLDEPDRQIAAVLTQVTNQTREFKTDRSMGQAARLPFVRYLWPLLRIPHRRASYQKLFPICAGVSTIAGSELRFGKAAAGILQYIRACPPGPAMPMVIAPTVMSGRLELGLVSRNSCLDEDQRDSLLEQILSRLEEFT
jgi:hypothetical protein